MTDKTPEDLAQEYANACLDLIPYGIYNENDARRDAFLAGYEAAKAEFLDEHYAIFYVDGVRYKVEKRRIVHSVSNIQRIETKED